MKRKIVQKEVVHLAVRAILLQARVLPRTVGLPLFALLGRIAFLALPRFRRIARRNLALAGASVGLGPQDAPRLFAAFGRNVYDALRLPWASREDVLRTTRLVHRERLDAALARGRGLVIVTGHLGCWELMAAAVARHGYPVNVVAERVKDERHQPYLDAIRQRHGSRVIDRRDDLAAMPRALRRGEIVAILIDQESGTEGVETEFLGHPTRVPIGPARLALATGAAVVPVGIHRRPDGCHEVEVGEEIPVSGAETAENAARLAREFSQAVESFILRHPTEWVWMHDRWKAARRAGRARGRTAFARAAALLLVLALGGCGSSPEESSPPTPAEVPDQVIAQFHRTETHEGRLQWKLTARRADVYDDQNRIDLVEMEVNFYNEEGGEPSHLSGDRGQVNTRTHDMMAEGNVVLENPDGVVLSTTQLFWRSAEEKMRTDRHVVITQNGDVVEGRGFVGDPSLKSFEILHSVDATVSGEEVESSE